MNLKNLRLANKKSQKEIADMLGVAQKTYSNYELGDFEPSIPKLIKLADYYDVTLDYLVDRPFSNTFGYLSDEEKKLISNFRNMNKSNQSKLIAQSEGILIAQKDIED